MDAQGAFDWLLGHLTTILVDEAKLLGGLHGDVESIKEEMEFMNGVLLHLTQAHHLDPHVCAWMKQIVGLARDCEGNVELYIHSVTDAGHHASGCLGYLRQIVRFVRTIPERHQIATRIRELKVKARNVGDMRRRYGIIVPPTADQDDAIFMNNDVQGPCGPKAKGTDAWRRSLLVNCTEDKEAYEQKIINDNIKSVLSEEEPVEELANMESQPRIFLMTWKKYNYAPRMEEVDRNLTYLITQKLCDQESLDQVPRMSSFSCKALIKFDTYAYKPLVKLLRKILHKVGAKHFSKKEKKVEAEQEDVLRVEAENSTETSLDNDDEDEAMQLTKKLEGYLRGKRFLIILQHVDYLYSEDRNRLMSAVLHATAHGSPGSAIVITAEDADLVESPYKILKPQSLFGAFYTKTMQLASCSEAYVDQKAKKKDRKANKKRIAKVLALCHPDAFAMKMFQHLLYVNPRRGKEQLEYYEKTLKHCQDSNKSLGKQMLRFSYNELPTNYRSCLLYLTIFREGDCIRRTTVCRRWVAEGLMMSREKHAEDEADCCFNALLSRGLIQPGEIGDTGKIKTCTLHPVVREVITRIARDIYFVDRDLPPDLARRLPVHSRTEVQASHADHSMQAADGNGIVAFLPYLAKSSQWQLMKILDLEGCRGLNENHLKSICEIILLKYLSLRNTGISKLPKQIEKLQCLETLDIRQTEIQSFATRSIMLPMLKHLLSGPKGSQDFFRVLCLPSGIRGMAKLETLSHVEASDSVNDLTDVGHLLRLRKLGVILSGEKGGLGVLFQQIEKLHGCLLSLSIQINQPPKIKDTITLASPPKLLQSLKISGITSGLLTWITELDQLTKITLSESYLGEDDICILGKLAALCCLRLRRNSYAGSGLTFKEEEFKSLESLGVDDDIITNITFDTGAAPKLETIVWSSATMEFISGVGSLPKLKKLELNGYCNPELVKQVFEALPDSVDFKHKQGHGRREDGATVDASTSMSN